MTEISKWGALGYQQVPGLANRLISRYLRTQRKNMLRFFTENGLFTFAERMRQIRDSRLGMLAKNIMFQEVLNDYAARAQAKNSDTQAAHLEDQKDYILAVPPTESADTASGDRAQPTGSVPTLAREDGSGIVIEE
jgi:hypothetical protein